MADQVRIGSYIAPVMVASKILGVLPITVTEEPKAVVSKVALVYSLVVPFLLAIYKFVHHSVSPFWTGKDNIFISTCYWLYPIVSCVCYLSIIRQTRVLCRALNEILLLCKMIPHKWYQRCRWFLVVEIAVCFLVTLSYVIVVFVKYPSADNVFNKILYRAAQFHAFVAFELINLQFSSALIFIAKLFSILNHNFLNGGIRLVKASNSSGKFQRSDVTWVIKLYGNVIKLCQAFNQCYGVSALCTAAYTFMHLVMALFASISLPWDLQMPFVLMVVGVFLYIQWIVLYACEKVVAETNKTAVIVHEVLAGTKDQRLKEQLQQFSLELLHRKMKFTACGLFPLDYSLLYAIIGGTTTYLVIIVQFSK